MRKYPQDFHGWLPIHKEPGQTSFDVIKHLRRVFPRGAKIGHAGTLDPDASGVLLVALGEATKLIPHAQDTKKVYRFRAHWGQMRDTDDDSGTIIAESVLRPCKEHIRAALTKFHGKIQQIPPQYSAKKIEGQRACDRLRRGEKIGRLEPCSVEVFTFDLIDDQPDYAEFQVKCSKGTYVRSLVRDLGQELGCFAYTSNIVRLQVGFVRLAACYKLEMLANLEKKSILPTMIKPPQAVLDDIPAVLVGVAEQHKLLQGQPIVVDVEQAVLLQAVNADQKLVALGCSVDGQFRPRRVFPQLIGNNEF